MSIVVSCGMAAPESVSTSLQDSQVGSSNFALRILEYHKTKEVVAVIAASHAQYAMSSFSSLLGLTEYLLENNLMPEPIAENPHDRSTVPSKRWPPSHTKRHFVFSLSEPRNVPRSASPEDVNRGRNIPRNICKVVKMNMANPISPWLLLKCLLPSFVVYETAIQKRATNRAKAPKLVFRWKLNQSGPLGNLLRRSDALTEKGKSTPQARKANTPCASHTFMFVTFTSFDDPLDRLRIVVVGDEVGILVVGLELGLAVVGAEVGIVVVGERDGLLVVGLRVGAVVGS